MGVNLVTLPSPPPDSLMHAVSTVPKSKKLISRIPQDLRKAHMKGWGTKLLFHVVVKKVLLEGIDRRVKLLS